MTKTIKKPKADYNGGGVSYPYPELEEKSEERILWPVSISLIGHLVVLAVLMFMPQPSFEKSYAPTVINVRMVTMGDLRSGDSASASAGESKPAPAPEPEPEPEPAPPPAEEIQAEPEIAPAVPEPEVTVAEKSPPPAKEPEPEVSLAPKEKTPEKVAEKPEAKEKPKIKKSLKKKTYKPTEIVKNAIEKLEKETEQSRPNTVLAAIEKLRKDVAENPRKATGSGGTGNSAGGGGSGFGGASGPAMGGMFDVYKVEVAYQIQRNWAFSEQLARGRKDLEVLVGIKIMPDGRIEDVWFDKKSGNQYLDDSALRAVKKSNPLPPLPKSFRGRFLETGLRFTPEGVGR